MNRRTGKVARLPEELRELVNRRLADGWSYQQIIAELEKRRDQWPQGITGFNKVNISQWSKGGYKEWLAQRELREERRAERQETFDFLRENGKDAVDKALPALAKHQLFNVLLGNDSRALAEQIAADPVQFARVVNTLSKLRKS